MIQAQPKVEGAVIEHWMDRRKRLRLPIELEGNVPRMSAETIVKLHNLKNKLMGTNISLHEASQQAAQEQKAQ